MSEYIIYLRLPPYLAQWLRHENERIPIEFPKNSMENDIIELGLIRKPILASVPGPGENSVAIAIPNFKKKDVKQFNYLPLAARRSLQQCIRTRFAIALWKDLHKFGNIGRRKQDLIYAWMEAHGIETSDKNWNTIAKIYMRKRVAYRKSPNKDRSKDG